MFLKTYYIFVTCSLVFQNNKNRQHLLIWRFAALYLCIYDYFLDITDCKVYHVKLPPAAREQLKMDNLAFLLKRLWMKYELLWVISWSTQLFFYLAKELKNINLTVRKNRTPLFDIFVSVHKPGKVGLWSYTNNKRL